MDDTGWLIGFCIDYNHVDLITDEYSTKGYIVSLIDIFLCDPSQNFHETRFFKI